MRPQSGRGRLRQNLGGWQVLALSIGLMAPSLAANINPQLAVADVGRAVPLAFVIATVGVLLVSYSFVRLTQHFNTSGSVYGFVGATLGPRAGVVAGWGLLGTYTFYAVVTSSAAGIFGTAFLNAVAVWPHPPSWPPFLLVGLVFVGVILLPVADGLYRVQWAVASAIATCCWLPAWPIWIGFLSYAYQHLNRA